MDRTLIFALVLLCIVPPYYLAMKLLFKKTIVFKLGLFMLLIFLSMPWAAFFVADKGFIHVWWAIPFCFVFIFTTFYLFLKQIKSPLQKLSDRINQISRGNLTVDFSDLDLSGDHEIAEISKSIIQHAEKLKEVIHEIQSTTLHLKTSSNEVNQSSQMLSQTVSEQAASTEEIYSSMEQMIASIQQTASNAKKTDQRTEELRMQLERMQKTTAENKNAVDIIANRIGIVNEIAFQTNILSLNAAVEAARAGENGRGFAVVAGEVRKLSERSKEAASDIHELSTQSVRTAEASEEIFVLTSSQIRDMILAMSEIAAASTEQSIGANQINTALEELNGTIQGTASSVEELAQTAEILNSFAVKLNNLMSFFKIGYNQGRRA